jgi:preprotein translocase SecF subunit
MQAIFASLASKGVGVSFANQRSSKEAPNVVLADVKLDAPMALDVVKGHIANANLGPYSEGIIQHEGDYGADVLVSDLTLVLPADKADRMQGMIKASFSEPRAVQGVVSIGATVAEEMQGRALLAVILSWAVMILYLGVRFRALRWGVAAVIALVHDVLITAGMMALADWSGVMGNVKMNLSMLAAFLTIIGYSVNDTIVVFDRIRENMANLGRKTVTADLIDMSVNQTLGRTVLTSATVFMVVVVLYFLGGSVLEGLALALIVGVITGTYSSVFIASPILLDWPALAGGTRALMSLLLLPLRLLFRGVRFALGGSR